MYIIILLIEEGGAGMVLEGLNKELAVREPPGLGIKEGAAISNTLTLKMEAQDIYNMVQMFRIPKCSTLNFEFFFVKKAGWLWLQWNDFRENINSAF